MSFIPRTSPTSSLPPRASGLARRELLALAPAIPLALSGAANAAGTADPVGTIVAEFVRAGRVDGISAAVVHGGRTRFHNAGLIARGGSTPATERSVYEIGSISKTFTGLLLAHAILEGRAAASDDVRKHLPPGYDNLARGDRPVRLIDLSTPPRPCRTTCPTGARRSATPSRNRSRSSPPSSSTAIRPKR